MSYEDNVNAHAAMYRYVLSQYKNSDLIKFSKSHLNSSTFNWEGVSNESHLCIGKILVLVSVSHPHRKLNSSSYLHMNGLRRVISSAFKSDNVVALSKDIVNSALSNVNSISRDVYLESEADNNCLFNQMIQFNLLQGRTITPVHCTNPAESRCYDYTITSDTMMMILNHKFNTLVTETSIKQSIRKLRVIKECDLTKEVELTVSIPTLDPTLIGDDESLSEDGKEIINTKTGEIDSNPCNVKLSGSSAMEMLSRTGVKDKRFLGISVIKVYHRLKSLVNTRLETCDDSLDKEIKSEHHHLNRLLTNIRNSSGRIVNEITSGAMYDFIVIEPDYTLSYTGRFYEQVVTITSLSQRIKHLIMLDINKYAGKDLKNHDLKSSQLNMVCGFTEAFGGFEKGNSPLRNIIKDENMTVRAASIGLTRNHMKIIFLLLCFGGKLYSSGRDMLLDSGIHIDEIDDTLSNISLEFEMEFQQISKMFDIVDKCIEYSTNQLKSYCTDLFEGGIKFNGVTTLNTGRLSKKNKVAWLLQGLETWFLATHCGSGTWMSYEYDGLVGEGVTQTISPYLQVLDFQLELKEDNDVFHLYTNR